jgi:hypothetical protein
MPVGFAGGHPEWRYRTRAGWLALWFGWLLLVAVHETLLGSEQGNCCVVPIKEFLR